MSKPTTERTKMSAKMAIVTLGVAAGMAYMAPTLTPLGEAAASGGGSGGGFFGFGSGGSGGGLRGFGSGTGGFIIDDPVTQKECSDCHEAYGPEALTQGAWRRIMGDLGNHFGENAMLPEDTRQHIENYLVSNAQPGDGPIRITELPWFTSEHRGERLGGAKSWANCQHCHKGRQR